MEIKVDEEVLSGAMAQAMLTLMGDDREKVLAAFMHDVLNSKVNSYGRNEEKPLFRRICEEEITKRFRSLVNEWLNTQEDALRDRIRSAVTNGQLDEFAQTLVSKATEAVAGAPISGRRY